MIARISRLADWLRHHFDRVPPNLGAVTVVGLLGAATGGAGALQSWWLQRGCGPLPIEINRLEVTFSVSRFTSLLRAAGTCAGNVTSSLISVDLLFALFYGPLLCAIYLWASRWRRLTDHDHPIPAPCSWRRDAIVVAPLLAAALDAIGENLPLWAAARSIGASLGASVDTAAVATSASALVTILVVIGSAASVLKWLLLVLSVAATVIELLSGERGAVLWRVRFSVLATLLGGAPLLAIPQGQDILQRLFEGDHPAWRLLAAVPPILLTTLAIWYCARKILELCLPGAPAALPGAGWGSYFAEQLPRFLGIVFLALVGTAFANAGQTAGRYLGVVGAVSLGALLARRYFKAVVGAIGRPFLLPGWEMVDTLDQRTGRLVLAAIFGLLVLFPNFDEGTSLLPTSGSSDATTVFYLRIAAYLCFVAAWIFQLYVRFRRTANAARQAHREKRAYVPVTQQPVVNALPLTRGLTRAVVAAGLTSLVLVLTFAAAPVPVGRSLGPLWILALTVINAVFFGTLSVWFSRRIRLPIVSPLILVALLFSMWNDNHAIRTMGPGSLPERHSISTELGDWMKDVPKDGPRIPVVLVAGAGGGLRAAYWTAMSLAVLQDEVPGFGRHMFAFSGVSGGSLGGALFVSLLRDAASADVTCPPPAYETPLDHASGFFASCVRAFMRDDHLSPVLAKLVGPDFVQLLLPFPVRQFDRSTALEQSWERTYADIAHRETFSEAFAQLSVPTPQNPHTPFLFLNATHVETGRRFVASVPVRQEGPSEEDRHLHDAGDVIDSLQQDLPLSVAVHNSARFTYVSPAGHLDVGDGHEHGRLVDGGYFENSGLATLREIYDVIESDAHRNYTSIDVYVLYLCNDPTTCNQGQFEKDTVPSSVADELLSPVRALLKTRDARGSLARASLLQLAGPEHFLQLNVCRDLPPAADADKGKKARDRVVSPPLGWLLSKLARDWMDASLVSGLERPPTKNCYSDNAATIAALRKAVGSSVPN